MGGIHFAAKKIAGKKKFAIAAEYCLWNFPSKCCHEYFAPQDIVAASSKSLPPI